MEEKVVILKEDGTEDKAAMKKQAIRNFVQDAADKAKRGIKTAWAWTMEHKEDLMWAGAAITGIIAGAKKLSTKTTQDSERYRIDHTYYDPSTGAHWQLRRQLTNGERAELMARRRAGEYTEDILSDMHVLKW